MGILLTGADSGGVGGSPVGVPVFGAYAGDCVMGVGGGAAMGGGDAYMGVCGCICGCVCGVLWVPVYAYRVVDAPAVAACV